MNEKIYKLLNQTVNDTDTEAEPLTDEEVKAMMKRFHSENNSENGKNITHKKHRFAAAMVAVAAAAVLVPTSVYAISRITAKIEQTADYQNTVKIEAPTAAEGLSANDEEYMIYELGYIPEGFVFGDENSTHAGKYKNYETDGGITTTFVRLPADGKEHKINLRFSENCENYESDGKTAMINYRVGYSAGGDKNGNQYGREVWISFNDTRYVLVLYVTNDISQDELYKIIDNISLKPTDEKRFGEYIWWEDPANYSSGSGKKKTEVNPHHIVDPDDENFLKIGETGDYNSDTLNCSFTINSAEFTDSFDGINTDGCGWEADYSAYMDENGNLLPNTRTWYTVGDGIYTLDEDIMSYDMPYHILKMNVTITNNADEYREFCICPNIVSFTSDSVPEYIEEDLNIPSGYEDMDIEFYDSLDRIRAKKYIDFVGGHFFSFDTDDAHMGFKNYVNLEAGESADFEIRFVCSENRLGNLYVSFYTTGNSFSESLKRGFPMYSLCDLRPE